MDIFDLSQSFFKILRCLVVLDLQLKVIEKRICELECIKDTMIKSINDALNSKVEDGFTQYFEEISSCLDENIENRKKWIDKWGFDFWTKNYDNSIKEDPSDGLNLFKTINK